MSKASLAVVILLIAACASPVPAEQPRPRPSVPASDRDAQVRILQLELNDYRSQLSFNLAAQRGQMSDQQRAALENEERRLRELIRLKEQELQRFR